MAEENKGAEGANKVKKERSTAYPGVSVQDAIEFSKVLVDSYGKSPFNRDAALQALKLKPGGSSFTKVAALVHYGLLTRQGNAYGVSELAERIIYFTSEEAQKAAIVEATLKPKLFSSLVTEYTGRAVPNLLRNILIQQHKINRNVADNVADIFKSSIEHAGLYVNGIITSTPSVTPEASEEDEGANAVTPTTHPANPMKTPPAQQAKIPAGMQSVALPSGIIISYPSEVAYLFALGKFGAQVSALEEAVSKAIKKDDDVSDPAATAE